MRVLSIITESDSRKRLRSAVGRGLALGSIEFFQTSCWTVAGLLADEVAPVGVVFDPHRGGFLDLDAAARFQENCPAAALVAYGRFKPGDGFSILRLAELGVAGVAIRDETDTPRVLRLMVEQARGGMPRAMLEGLGPVSPDLLPILAHLLARTLRPLCPTGAARLAFCHPKTLRARLRRSGLPPLNQLIVWLRLFHAAQFLGSSPRTLESLSCALGHRSPDVLRKQIRRYLGCGIRDLRQGGLPLALERFRERREARSGALGYAHE